MRNYKFHYRTFQQGTSRTLNINADNFSEAIRLFFTQAKNRNFKTFRVEFQ